MKPFCTIETPFPEKFGVPRQPLLINEAWGKMVFPKNDFYSEAFRGLENFSHLWLIFEFHHIPDQKTAALVRPPRFENKKKMGVFATRSPHRPNRIGLSVVKFDRLEIQDNEVVLWVRGVDLVSGTPIYDIKPYLPYADSVPEARAIEFEEAPKFYPVKWDDSIVIDHDLKVLVEKVIALDPRPGQDKSSSDEFALSVAGVNVSFKKEEDVFVVLKLCFLP